MTSACLSPAGCLTCRLPKTCTDTFKYASLMILDMIVSLTSWSAVFISARACTKYYLRTSVYAFIHAGSNLRSRVGVWIETMSDRHDPLTHTYVYTIRTCTKTHSFMRIREYVSRFRKHSSAPAPEAVISRCKLDRQKGVQLYVNLPCPYVAGYEAWVHKFAGITGWGFISTTSVLLFKQEEMSTRK